MMVAAVALVLANVVFYQRIGGWLGVLLGGLMVWFLLLVGMVAVYVFPVLVTQEGSVWATVRHSFLLSVDNIKLSLVFLLSAGLALGLGVASGWGCSAAAWRLGPCGSASAFTRSCPSTRASLCPVRPHAGCAN